MLEAADAVGGLARTEVRDGYRFDLGGHRFFTKSPEVEALWLELLGAELLLRPRLSRIYWRGRLIDYPLRAGDVIRKVGPAELARSAASYAAARLRPRPRGRDASRSGSRSASAGACSSSSSAPTRRRSGACRRPRSAPSGQRSGSAACRCGARRRRALGAGGGEVRSLIEEFHYPRLGPGQMWERMADEIVAAGGEIAPRLAR